MLGKFLFSFTFFPTKATPKNNSKTNDVTHFALLALMKQIEITYRNAQHKIKEEIEKSPTPSNLNWHTRFIANQKNKFAALDKVDLNCIIINSIYNDTVRNWIHGFYGVNPRSDETLVQYSMRATNESWMYQATFEEFKSSWELVNLNLIKTNALKAIKKLIESDIENWLNKKNKNNLNYIDEIYRHCVQVDTLDNPTLLFDQIHLILINFIKNYLKSDYQTIEEAIAENEEHGISLIN